MEENSIKMGLEFPEKVEGVTVRYAVIKDEVAQSEFERSAFIDLTKNPVTPADILEAEFEETEKVFRFLASVRCDTEVTYSASVGYDREEKYEEYNSSKKQYETKTRTVTDWKPHSGNRKATLCEYVDIETEKALSYSLKNVKKQNILGYPNEELQTPAPRIPTRGALKAGEYSCLGSLKYQCKSNLPGDRYENFSASGNAKAIESASIVVSQYALPYKYGGKKYCVHGFAAGETYSTDETVNVSYNNADAIGKKTFIYSVAALVCALVSCIISLAVRNTAAVCVLFVLSLASFVTFKVMNVVIRNKAVNSQKEIKIDKLKKLLAKRGLAELSETEINTIGNGINTAKLGVYNRYSSSKQGKTYTAFKWAGLALFVLSVICFFAGLLMSCVI
ncbi:MAG: hypothetical protein K2N30_05225 [Clostridia bacterium]|nr:hypothetical protein [Clostridia bacterium]